MVPGYWNNRIRYPFDPFNKIFSGYDLEYFGRRIGPRLPKWCTSIGPPVTGRLAQVVEGGGKRRSHRELYQSKAATSGP